MRNNDVLFRLNTIENKVFISFDLYESEGYDKISCESLKLETPQFIIPMRAEKTDNVITVRYQLPDNYLPVKDYTNTMTIEQILSLYNKVYTYMEECREWYLIPQGFCFDFRYVYVDENAEDVLFLYIPDCEKNVDSNQIKELFINLLEKCEETSGDKIQLQLYKYFYKPGFDLVDFKSVLNKYKEQGYVKKTQVVKTVELAGHIEEPLTIKVPKAIEIPEAIELAVTMDEVEEPYNAIDKQDELPTDSDFMVNLQMDGILAEVERDSEKDKFASISEDKSFDVKEIVDEDLRGSYYAKPSRTQLSQEEIEEMVNTICNVKPETSSSQEEAPVNEPKLEEGKKVGLDNIAPEDKVYGRNAMKPTDEHLNRNTDALNKKRNILDNVFSPAKPSKPQGYQDTGKGATLLVVGSHPRYDLPKSMKVQFQDAKFVIGRATRTGEPTGANYEFGAEITPISRIHAQIERSEEAFFLRDLGSSNGTFLNGVKLEANKQYVLKNGDKVAFAIAFSKNSIEYIFRV